MSEWFREAFRGHYLSLYAHRDEEEARQTVALITGVLALRPGTRVLDAPCGAGRHARGFAWLGFRTTAMDLSTDLLHAARQADGDSRPPGVPAGRPLPSPDYVRADLRALPFPARHFDLVTNLFSSFGYLATDAENFGVLEELARVCRPGGHVVIDFFNAGLVRASLEPESLRRTAAGWLVRERREIRGEPPRVEKHIRIESAGGQMQEIRESVRLYTREELEQMLARAGVPVVRRFGDYAGSPLTGLSPRVILFGRRTE